MTKRIDSADGAESRAINAAFRREQRTGAMLGFRVRTAGVAIIALSLLLRASGVSLAYYLTILAVLLVTGYLFYLSAARDMRRGGVIRAALVALDMGLITMALVVPAPGVPDAWPAAMQLRLGDIGFLFVFLAFSALTYSPGLALWAGLAAGGAWVGGFAWALSQPGSFTRGASEFADMSIEQALATLLDPFYVSVIATAQEAILLAITGAIVAAAVWRGRRQALRQIGTARERAKLARYFSPDVAEELTHSAAGLEAMKTREAAILFADIVDFTGAAERMDPEETIRFLREFHAIATAEVFAQRGTLNKFIGDEVMASFGAITDIDAPAAAAVRCALGVSRRVAEWSDRREAAGLDPVRVGVGVHIGPVVVGNIGDRRCLELAVLGDVVNIASRLQDSTRAHGANIVASRAALAAARDAAPGIAAEIADFHPIAGALLRGRTEEVESAAFTMPNRPEA